MPKTATGKVTFLRFNAAPKHRLLAFGREIHGGEIFDLHEMLAEALAADPNNNVSIVDQFDVPTEPVARSGEGQTNDPPHEQEDKHGRSA